MPLLPVPVLRAGRAHGPICGSLTEELGGPGQGLGLPRATAPGRYVGLGWRGEVRGRFRESPWAQGGSPQGGVCWEPPAGQSRLLRVSCYSQNRRRPLQCWRPAVQMASLGRHRGWAGLSPAVAPGTAVALPPPAASGATLHGLCPLL